MKEKTYKELDFCLLIPCYNNEAGLIKSLASIYYDTSKYLVLVVDDGSLIPVKKEDLLQQLHPSQQIEIISLKYNAGITNALNVGLDWIYKNVECKYIARLDCGDTCERDRFNLQVAEMDNHPDLLLLGSWCRFVRSDGSSYVYRTPVDEKKIRRGMYFRNLFIHPSFMLRTLPDGPLEYPTAYSHAEDYALAWILLKRGSAKVLPNVLVNCEINAGGISESNRRIQLQSRWHVIKELAVNNILKVPAFIYLFILRIIPRKLILAYKLRKQ